MLPDDGVFSSTEAILQYEKEYFTQQFLVSSNTAAVEVGLFSGSEEALCKEEKLRLDDLISLNALG